MNGLKRATIVTFVAGLGVFLATTGAAAAAAGELDRNSQAGDQGQVGEQGQVGDQSQVGQQGQSGEVSGPNDGAQGQSGESN